MKVVNEALADRLTLTAVRLTRWLRLADPAPQLSGPQASALAVIVYAQKIRPSELADMEEVKRPSIARTIAQLTQKGLIERIADPDDARSVFLIPTKAGVTLIADGQRRRIEPLRRALTRLSVEERRIVVDAISILEKMPME